MLVFLAGFFAGVLSCFFIIGAIAMAAAAAGGEPPELPPGG